MSNHLSQALITLLLVAWGIKSIQGDPLVLPSIELPVLGKWMGYLLILLFLTDLFPKINSVITWTTSKFKKGRTDD